MAQAMIYTMAMRVHELQRMQILKRGEPGVLEAEERGIMFVADVVGQRQEVENLVAEQAYIDHEIRGILNDLDKEAIEKPEEELMEDIPKKFAKQQH